MANYKIQTLEVGYDPKFPAGVAFDFWHMGDQQVYSPFSMTLLSGEGHHILFDCGFCMEHRVPQEKIAQEQDQCCHTAPEVLATVGLMPEDIDTVILSHLHWDHMSGLVYFPHATFYLQKEEAEGWFRAMEDEHFPLTHKSVMDPEGLEVLKRYLAEGRVVLLEGDTPQLFPDIDVISASGHSFAQNLLFIENQPGGRIAVIGDAAMRPESFTGTGQFPCILPNLKFAVGSIEEISHSYRRILDWVGGDVDRIFMTHDGTLQDRRPTVRSSLGLNITSLMSEEGEG